jgi:hypothetical protein
MKQLRIYMHPSGDSALHRSGFSWTAAFVFPVWAVTRRLYKTALAFSALIFAASQILPVLFATFGSAVVQGFGAAVYVVCYWMLSGSLASRWHRHVLERGGYVLTAREP